ncbi:uncharacterized protein H6S33_013043 [Morchella sextelata]|uniref:uncharacterized protein n=1 Tax=Morchella sextelata TaxID=1174677 RepID=UPI001D0392D4|nr:uncharacterized protein H6S33_013043 [Morchella sextelata]KAH0609557.1 hypothetical protein H6S33_013043 [Morchella sextelata]
MGIRLFFHLRTYLGGFNSGIDIGHAVRKHTPWELGTQEYTAWNILDKETKRFTVLRQMDRIYRSKR